MNTTFYFCITAEVTLFDYQKDYNMSWTLKDADNVTKCESKPLNSYKDFGFEWIDSKAELSFITYKESCSLEKGKYTLSCKESNGNGWDKGFVKIEETEYCESFTSGNEMNVELSLGIS